ncbi:transcriptional regulator [Herbaspirillum sp. CF444]|uniref:LysR family transcriptional regulator n=1 Tax=Herbaspirillum sp. CF444 TaxID=1144319 RepID=UPI0002725E29|nr:LysR family transcriptional regulator [Herbaspirillum sp. CF444]EJL80890.1 transcriptional regulator [Herbaspirillum sp. CF444]
MDRLNAMATFVNVVESGSFSGAARRLEVGQPAVSKTIAQLEERLGVRLLLRSTRGLTPTEAGQRFYERALRAIEEADAAERSARDAGTGLSGPLRICAAVTFTRLRILPYLQPFLDLHPQLSLDIVLDDRHIDMLEEGIDVALRMGSLTDSGMTARKIAQSPRSVVGTPAYFARRGVPATPADLGCHSAVIYGRVGGGSWEFRRGSTEVSVAVSGRIRVNAAEGVRAAVLADMGLAISSEWMFEPELASGALQRVLTEWELPPVDLWAVYPGGRMASAKARAFIAYVEELLSAR